MTPGILSMRVDLHVQEISHFVAANWTQLEDHDTGATYFYNQITHETQFDQPIQPQRVRFLTISGLLISVQDQHLAGAIA